jgi:glutamyl-tRNA synthetase
MAETSAFFYRDFEAYEEKSAQKHLKPAALEPLLEARTALASIDDWAPDAIHGVVAGVADKLGLGMGKVAQPLRVAVVGRAASPGIDVTLHLVGREATLRRVDRAIAFVRERTDAS